MRTRFAPSPTGPLHLGHAYSAWVAFDLAQQNQGAFLLRIEDIDQQRSRAAWEEQIYDDLAWLGLTWKTPVLRQSDRSMAYNAALDALWAEGLLYPCTCNRRDVLAAARAPNEGEPLVGPDGIVYPGTCRPENAPTGNRPTGVALRLDMARALKKIEFGQADVPLKDTEASTFPIFFEEGITSNRKPGPMTIDINALITTVGDVVLARRDMGTSYHLAVVIDDAFQDVTHVVRGKDLFDATQIHVLLQRLLRLPTPRYFHHPLIRDEDGKRLAKRHDSKAISLYREQGVSPEDLRSTLGLN